MVNHSTGWVRLEYLAPGARADRLPDRVPDRDPRHRDSCTTSSSAGSRGRASCAPARPARWSPTAPGRPRASPCTRLQDRGSLFVGPGEEVYEGMIVGENARAEDLDVNPTKQKHQTNVRAASADILVRLIPPRAALARGRARVPARGRVRRDHARQPAAAQGRAGEGRARARRPGRRRGRPSPARCNTPEMTPSAFPKLSVLDLAIVGEGSSHAEALANSVDLAQTVERLGYHRHWVAEHHNMPGIASSAPAGARRDAGRGDRADPGRLRRRDAAQPRAAGRRRAVRDARGAAPRPDRPRHRPRAGHRPDHRRRPAPLGRPALRRGLPAPARRADRLLPAASSPDGHPYRHITAVPGVGDHAGDLAARLLRLLGAARRDARACRSPSPTTSCRATPTPRSSSTAAASSPPSSSPSPTRWSPCAAICAEDDERARYLSGPGAALDGAPARRPADPLPDPRGGGRARVQPPPRRQSVSALSGSAAIGGPETVRGEARRARRAHRRRRADDHDDGPRPRRPGPLLRADRRACTTWPPPTRPPPRRWRTDDDEGRVQRRGVGARSPRGRRSPG